MGRKIHFYRKFYLVIKKITKLIETRFHFTNNNKFRIASMIIFLPFKKNWYQYLICNKENYKFNFILLVYL